MLDKSSSIVVVLGPHKDQMFKSLACWFWRPTGKVIDHISKDGRSDMLKRFDYVDPQDRLNLSSHCWRIVKFAGVFKEKLKYWKGQFVRAQADEGFSVLDTLKLDQKRGFKALTDQSWHKSNATSVALLPFKLQKVCWNSGGSSYRQSAIGTTLGIKHLSQVGKELYLGLHQLPSSCWSETFQGLVIDVLATAITAPDINVSLFVLVQGSKDSPFDLEAFSDDYAGVSLDRKSTTGGCQFLGKRLISWQCKKQTIVANSTTKAKYVAAANCYGQVLWIQNQMLDYGFNFMNTKIYIDNESIICIMKIQGIPYEKKLIQVIKIHTDHNVADLLHQRPFAVSRRTYAGCFGLVNSVVLELTVVQD
ncbi:hypothetical protein Tco_0276099 [Tanacetum coccineum]